MLLVLLDSTIMGDRATSTVSCNLFEPLLNKIPVVHQAVNNCYFELTVELLLHFEVHSYLSNKKSTDKLVSYNTMSKL